jgi:hypothetical protein
MVRFSMFMVVPSFVNTAPVKKPAVGSWAVMVWPAPFTVTPSGTVSSTVVSQFAVNVNVEPLIVPVHAVVTLGSAAAEAVLPAVITTGATPNATTVTRQRRPIRNRDTATSFARR